jgi:dolichyl-phosphate beta-glucosyltransferase
MSPIPDVSLIVPAYNEEERLPSSLEKIGVYLDRRPFAAEVVVVDDGSSDGTADLVSSWPDERFRLLRNPGNRGKGYAVRHGMRESTGEIRIFTDADLSTPVEEVDAALAHHERGFDVVAGSRSLARSQVEVRQPWYRQGMGRTFNIFVRTLVLRGFVDTQCGFKSFTREAAEAVFRRARVDGFAFDVEILMLARRLGFSSVEVPVRWVNSPDSRVSPVLHSAQMLFEILRIRFDVLRGVYDRAL